MDAITCMTTRHSVRKYRDVPVTKENLNKILECGRFAPTGVNHQGWKFIVCTDETKQKVADATDYGKFIANAPVVICVAIDKSCACPYEDSANAACNMLNAAHALGYGGCWIGANGNDTAKRVEKVLSVPSTHKIMAIFSVGVPDEDTRREKKPLSEIVSYNHF